MEERLSVRIEADIKNFQSGMSQVENNLKRAEGIFQSSSRSAFQLENAIAQLSREFKEGAVSRNQYNAQLSHLNAELTKQRSNVSASAREIDRLNKLMSAQKIQKVATANTAASKSFQGLATNVRGSNTVAMEFNRIIQDAPFGMMGIGNNIQQLSANFSNLSKNAGGTVPALKAAFSAMVTGPNLALLAISALTAGITAYNMGAFDFISANKEKKKSLEDLQKELDEYRATLSTVQQQSIVGAQNAQQELATLDALAAQARNTALSNEQRTAAVEELQKKYPSYLGNLTDEQIKTGDVSEEMSKLRTNLIETAKAYAMIDKVRENSIALLDLEARALTRAQEIREKVEEIASNRERDRSGAANINATISRQNRLQQELNSILEEQTADYNKIREIQSENLSLQDRTNQALANGGNIVSQTATGIASMQKALNEYSDQLSYFKSAYGDIISAVKSGVKLTDDQTKRYGKLLDALKDHEAQLKRINSIDPNQLFAVDPSDLQKDLEKSLTQASKDVKKQQDIVVPVKVDLSGFKSETLSGDVEKELDNLTEGYKKYVDVIAKYANITDPKSPFFNAKKMSELTKEQIKTIATYAGQISTEMQNAFQASFSGSISDESLEMLEAFANRMKFIESLGGQLQNTLSGAFEQSMLTGDNFFKSFAEGFKKMLAQMAAQLAASAVIKFLGFIVGVPAGGALAAGGGGSMLGSLFGGAAMRIGQTPAIGSPTGGSSSAGYRVDVNVHGVLRGNDIHVANQRNNRDFNRYY